MWVRLLRLRRICLRRCVRTLFRCVRCWDLIRVRLSCWFGLRLMSRVILRCGVVRVM